MKFVFPSHFLPPRDPWTATLTRLAPLPHMFVPLEVYEHIIDACYEENSIYYWSEINTDPYRTWLRTALVCSDWLPRTRFNLYHDIRMHRTPNYDLLLRTLSHSPHLADLIRRVHIVWSGHEIYTFGARLLKPQLLKNCARVYLQVSEWPALPYRYANIAFYPFRTSNLTHFVAELRHDTCSPIIRFLYTLPLLQHLDLECTTSAVCIPEHYLQILHERPCPFDCLTNLKLYVCRINTAYGMTCRS